MNHTQGSVDDAVSLPSITQDGLLCLLAWVVSCVWYVCRVCTRVQLVIYTSTSRHWPCWDQSLQCGSSGWQTLSAVVAVMIPFSVVALLLNGELALVQSINLLECFLDPILLHLCTVSVIREMESSVW